LSEAIVSTAVGEVLIRLGRLDEAARVLADAITLAEAVGARTPLAAASVAAAELATLRGDRTARDAHLGRALSIAQMLGLGRYLVRAARLGDAGAAEAAPGV
jgi:uncharacterized protein HemY